MKNVIAIVVIGLLFAGCTQSPSSGNPASPSPASPTALATLQASEQATLGVSSTPAPSLAPTPSPTAVPSEANPSTAVSNSSVTGASASPSTAAVPGTQDEHFEKKLVEGEAISSSDGRKITYKAATLLVAGSPRPSNPSLPPFPFNESSQSASFTVSCKDGSDSVTVSAADAPRKATKCGVYLDLINASSADLASTAQFTTSVEGSERFNPQVKAGELLSNGKWAAFIESITLDSTPQSKGGAVVVVSSDSNASAVLLLEGGKPASFEGFKVSLDRTNTPLQGRAAFTFAYKSKVLEGTKEKGIIGQLFSAPNGDTVQVVNSESAKISVMVTRYGSTGGEQVFMAQGHDVKLTDSLYGRVEYAYGEDLTKAVFEARDFLSSELKAGESVKARSVDGLSVKLEGTQSTLSVLALKQAAAYFEILSKSGESMKLVLEQGKTECFDGVTVKALQVNATREVLASVDFGQAC